MTIIAVALKLIEVNFFEYITSVKYSWFFKQNIQQGSSFYFVQSNFDGSWRICRLTLLSITTQN